MPRFIRSLILTVATLAAPASAPIASSLFVSRASAQSFHPLCEISDEYRDATVAFERHVYRAKYFDCYDERLADRLECVAREFRSAAKNPEDVRRLLYHWQDLTATHFRVKEMLIAVHGNCDPELLRCWQPVAETFACLAEEMKCFSGHHHSHQGSSGPGMGGIGTLDLGRSGANGEYDVHSQRLPSHAVPNGYQDMRGVQIESRREIGAAIAASILSRLLN